MRGMSRVVNWIESGMRVVMRLSSTLIIRVGIGIVGVVVIVAIVVVVISSPEISPDFSEAESPSSFRLSVGPTITRSSRFVPSSTKAK